MTDAPVPVYFDIEVKSMKCSRWLNILVHVLLTIFIAFSIWLSATMWARAVEIIGNAPSWATYAQAAAATGLTDAKGVPLTQGPLGDGGSWFYNAVGDVSVPTGNMTTCKGPGGVAPCPEMQTLPGKWVRVRFNGDSPNLPDLIKVWRAFGITIYERLPLGPSETLCWSSDGATCGPAYLDLIGVIA